MIEWDEGLLMIGFNEDKDPTSSHIITAVSIPEDVIIDRVLLFSPWLADNDESPYRASFHWSYDQGKYVSSFRIVLFKTTAPRPGELSQKYISN